jgi:hypothetical protein
MTNPAFITVSTICGTVILAFAISLPSLTVTERIGGAALCSVLAIVALFLWTRRLEFDEQTDAMRHALTCRCDTCISYIEHKIEAN